MRQTNTAKIHLRTLGCIGRTSICVFVLLVAVGGYARAAEDEPLYLTGDTKPPERTVFVAPQYPEAARNERVEGKVVLEIVVDRAGEVEDVKVLKSNALFDQAAVEAVRKWKYKPATKDGKPVKVYLTVIVDFNLKSSAVEDEKAIYLSGDIKPPERTVYVKPEYPETAKKDRIEGKVIFEVVVNREGDIEDVRVLRSNPVFDEAAMKAVKQWKYQPALKDGKPVKVYLTVIVEFKREEREG